MQRASLVSAFALLGGPVLGVAVIWLQNLSIQLAGEDMVAQGTALVAKFQHSSVALHWDELLN